jgi:four helix bundle protein
MVERKEEGRRKEEEGRGKGERGFRKLVAWQKADELASAVFQDMCESQSPPWLQSQVTRAAVSVPANIAEGYAREALRDYLRFLDIAWGSLAELEYYLHFLSSNRLLTADNSTRLSDQASEVGNILTGLIRSLRVKLQDGSWDRLRVSEDQTGYETIRESADLLPSSSNLLPGVEG